MQAWTKILLSFGKIFFWAKSCRGRILDGGNGEKALINGIIGYKDPMMEQVSINGLIVLTCIFS